MKSFTHAKPPNKKARVEALFSRLIARKRKLFCKSSDKPQEKTNGNSNQALKDA